MPKKSPHPSNLAAARSGDRLAALEKLRDTLAEQLDETDKAIHAQLAAQYRATLEAIAALEPPQESAHARFAARVANANVVA
jgi:predicted kinase